MKDVLQKGKFQAQISHGRNFEQRKQRRDRKRATQLEPDCCKLAGDLITAVLITYVQLPTTTHEGDMISAIIFYFIYTIHIESTFQ